MFSPGNIYQSVRWINSLGMFKFFIFQMFLLYFDSFLYFELFKYWFNLASIGLLQVAYAWDFVPQDPPTRWPKHSHWHVLENDFYFF